MKLKKYSRITLSTNVPNSKRITLNVSKSILNKLEKLKYSGGFKRFEIDIVDEVEAYSNDHSHLKVFLIENNLGF